MLRTFVVLFATMLFVAPVTKLMPFAWKLVPIYGGGAIMVVSISPHDKNVALAGSDVGGVFRTDNGGKTWRIANRGLRSDGDMAIADIAWHPREPNVVYLATGKCFGKPIGGYGGLFVSEDGGKSWKLLSRAVRFSGFGTYRQRGNVIKILDNGVILAGTAWDGLLRSVDGGKNWEKVGLEGNFIIGLAVVSEEIIIVATLDTKESKGGVWITEDSGKNWRQTLVGEDVQSIAVDAKKQRIYAAIREKGVAISDDLGKSWKISSNSIWQFLQHQWLNAVVVNPVKPSVVYLCASERFGALEEWWKWRHPGIFVSDNSGESWRPIVSKSIKPDGSFDISAYLRSIDDSGWWRGKNWFGFNPMGIAIDHQNGTKLMLNDWYGVWLSEDGGEHWVAGMNGLAVTCVATILCHPKRRNEVYFGLLDVGLFRSDDAGNSVHHLNSYPSSNCTNLAINVESNSLYSVVGGKLFVSKNRGEDWEIVGEVPKEAVNCHVACDPFSQNKLYCGSFVSNDGGRSWQRMGELSGSWRIFPNPAKNGSIYAVSDERILASSDGGKNWQDISYRLPFVHPGRRLIRAFSVQPRTGRIFAGLDVHGLFCSDNDGKTWRCVLPRQYISAIACANDGQTVVVGTWRPWFAPSEEYETGIFLSRDGGESWWRIDSSILFEFGNIAIPSALAVDPFYPARVFLGTHGNGAMVGEFGE